MLLLAILATPLAAAIVCAAVKSRGVLELVNLIMSVLLCPLSIALAMRIVRQEQVGALGDALHADALSALVVCLTAFVGFATTIYAVGHAREDARTGKLSATQIRRLYTLMPLLTLAMLLVPLANNLGVMWVAIEAATLAS